VHTNTKRPWHNEGKRVGRLKPRHNAEVNGWWMCDEGRYGWSSIKGLDEARLGRVMRLKASPLAPDSRAARREITWEDMTQELTDALREGISKKGAKGLALACSGMLSNEDWDALKKFFVDTLGVTRLYFSPEPDQIGEQDDLLRRKEKVPNLAYAEKIGLKSGDWKELSQALEKGETWGIYCVEHELTKILGADGDQKLLKLEFLAFQGPHKLATAELAHYRLPATAYVEEEGHFTNFEGKVQKYEAALAPLGLAEPDWRIFERLGAAWSARPARREAARA
jgi:NADH-quinone oxidoreductase subunit G